MNHLLKTIVIPCDLLHFCLILFSLFLFALDFAFLVACLSLGEWKK